jgi:hypothetical protein
VSRERQAGFKELSEIDLRVPLFEVQPVALALSMREAEASINKRVLGPGGLALSCEVPKLPPLFLCTRRTARIGPQSVRQVRYWPACYRVTREGPFGSKCAPVFHITNKTTASLRASATRAR